MKEQNNTKHHVADLLFIFVIIYLVAILSSCTTTKQVSKEKTSYDAQLQQRLIDSNRVLRQENEKLQQDIKEAEYAIADFDSSKCPEIEIPSCPAMLNADSVSQLVNDLNAAISGLNNKVRFYADGSVEYSGRLKQFKYANEKQQITIQEKNRLVDSLAIALKEAKSNVKIEVREKTVDKKTTVFPWWFLLITGFFAFLWLRKQFPNLLKNNNMKNFLFLCIVSMLFIGCGGPGVQPSDNITWGQAFNHVSHSFGYWIWVALAFLAIVGYIYAVASGKVDSLNLLLLFALGALLMLAIFMRPSEVAANTTVEQAARGVFIGY